MSGFSPGINTPALWHLDQSRCFYINRGVARSGAVEEVVHLTLPDQPVKNYST